MAEQYPSLSDAKIPFASYDTVVYFGGGTFFLAVLGFYFKTAMPPFPNPSSFNEYVSSAITAIGILFFVYLIGHGIAFLSALFVEGLCTSTYGFPSYILRNDH